jgi:hypothetical protein
MDDSGEYLRSVVRVFPDYAHTVIWFAPGPVDYADARVTDALRDAMVAWEQAWYDGMTEDLHFSSAEVARSLAAEGQRLAAWLSTELGEAFEVEAVLGGTGAENERSRGTAPGSNPEAVAAFRRLAAEDKAEHERIQALVAGGASHSWTVGPGPGPAEGAASN